MVFGDDESLVLYPNAESSRKNDLFTGLFTLLAEDRGSMSDPLE